MKKATLAGLGEIVTLVINFWKEEQYGKKREGGEGRGAHISPNSKGNIPLATEWIFFSLKFKNLVKILFVNQQTFI